MIKRSMLRVLTLVISDIVSVELWLGIGTAFMLYVMLKLAGFIR